MFSVSVRNIHWVDDDLHLLWFIGKLSTDHRKSRRWHECFVGDGGLFFERRWPRLVLSTLIMLLGDNFSTRYIRNHLLNVPTSCLSFHSVGLGDLAVAQVASLECRCH